MATSDVSIKSSLGEVTGASIVLQVGAVPYASVTLRPGGEGANVSGGGTFPDIDARRRASLETLEIAVRIRKGDSSGEANRTFNFEGYLDGYSVSNVVGGNSYQAILKHKAQSLLELTTIMPGLYPTSTNIYKIASHSITTTAQGEESESVKLWNRLASYEEVLKLPPIKAYVAFLKVIIKTQQKGWESFAGVDKMISGNNAFKDIFEAPSYKKNLESCLQLLNKLNYDACEGEIDNLVSAGITLEGMRRAFTEGSTIFLENLLGFLSTLGCSLIFGKDETYIVPINSVLKQEPYKPGPGVLSTAVNKAGPADYNGYSFQDIGYRDVNSVILIAADYVGGSTYAAGKFDTGVITCFAAPAQEAKGSGVYVVRAHPWMALSTTAPAGTDARKGKIDLDGENSLYDKKQSFAAAVTETGKAYSEVAQTKEKAIAEKPGKFLKNYAETKYYQARFTDRQGTITLDFNPKWAPGTGGILYVRKTEMFLHFYVHTVTHTVEHTPPAVGSALTIISFNCGRFGPSPAGSDGDLFLGYTPEIEEMIRENFAASYE